MGLKTFGSGWDPNSGWAPDDSTDIPWNPEVEIPGQFKGGGAGFGPGDFQGSPKITAPASGPPPGLSLSNGGADGGTFDPRTSSAFRGPRWGGNPPPGFNMGDEAASPIRNPFTAPHVDQATGQLEMLTGPGGLVEKTRGTLNPFGFIGRGNPYWRAAIAGAEATRATPAETGELSPRFFTGQGVQPGLSAPQGTPYEVPRGMPGRAVDAPASYPHMPWPDTGVAPAAAPAASPAATRQRPNLGTYGAPPAAVANSPFTTFDRPNMSPQNSAQGRQGAPQMGMLDLSRLFAGGQPAPAAAAPQGGGGAPTAANPNNPYWGPNAAGRAVAGGPLMPQDITGYPVAGVNVPAAASGFTVNPDLKTRRPRSKSSSTSEGGGFNK